MPAVSLELIWGDLDLLTWLPLNWIWSVNSHRAFLRCLCWLISLFVPVPDFTFAVPGDLKMWHVCLMILMILIALWVCVLVYVVCIEGAGTTEKLLSMNILAVINSSCQKDIWSWRKHPKKQPLALACWARLPGWWSNSSTAAIWAGGEAGN